MKMQNHKIFEIHVNSNFSECVIEISTQNEGEKYFMNIRILIWKLLGEMKKWTFTKLQ